MRFGPGNKFARVGLNQENLSHMVFRLLSSPLALLWSGFRFVPYPIPFYLYHLINCLGSTAYTFLPSLRSTG